MKQLKLICGLVITGITVALTYHVFENAVHGSIDLIWNDWFNTASNRLLVVPLCVVLTFVYFGAQHFFDRSAEHKESSGLGDMPTPTIVNYLKILAIGFLSLVAGASLGPEAVLVPACMVLGAYVGKQLFKGDKELIGLLAAAGMIALFTAFFHSFLVGVLSLALVVKQANMKLKPQLVLVAALASASSWLTLKAVSGEAYIELPPYSWALNTESVLLSLALVAGGFAAIFGMDKAHAFFVQCRQSFIKQNWWLNALVAGLGLSALYLLGGALVEFTGNQSIVPLFEKAPELGLAGLVWILIIKITAISWSKAIGYRGGMIFPTIFVAATLVAIVQIYVHDYNLIYGLIAVLVGAFAANHKTHILA